MAGRFLSAVRQLVGLPAGDGDEEVASAHQLPGGVKPEEFIRKADAGKPAGYDDDVKTALAYLRGNGGRDTIKFLEQVFPNTARNMTPATLNVFGRIIGEQARVFAGEGKVELVGPDGQVNVEETARFNEVLKEAGFRLKTKDLNRMVRAVKRADLRVSWDPDDACLCLNAFGPHAVHVEFDPEAPRNLNRARGLLADIDPAYDDKGNEIRRWEFWSADPENPKQFIVDEEGRVYEGESEGKNEYVDERTKKPIVPFVRFTDCDEDGGLYQWPSQQLLSAQRNVDGNWTAINHVARLQGFGVWVLTQTAEDAKAWNLTPGDVVLKRGLKNVITQVRITVGPERPLRVPFGWKAEHVAQQAPLDELLRVQESYLREVAICESVPASAVLSEQQAESGVALEIRRIPLTELRQDQLDLYSKPVRKLLRVMIAVWNAHHRDGEEAGKAFDPYLEPRWTPGEVELPRDPEQKTRVRQADIRDGVTSPAREIAKEARIPLEEAKVRAAEIAAENKAGRTPLSDIAPSLFGRPAAKPVADEADVKGQDPQKPPPGD